MKTININNIINIVSNLLTFEFSVSLSDLINLNFYFDEFSEIFNLLAPFTMVDLTKKHNDKAKAFFKVILKMLLIRLIMMF